MGGGVPEMGRAMPGMEGGMPEMGRGMTEVAGDIPDVGGGGKDPTADKITQMQQQEKERGEKFNLAAARIILSTYSQDGMLKGYVYFANGHVAHYQWGWLIEIPSDGKGPGCSPLTTKHKEGQLIALIKRGGCSFADKATNGGTKMSIIYNNKDKLIAMAGLGKYENEL